MTAKILQFPVPPGPVRITREERIFLVVCRDHGWLHSNFLDACVEAAELAAGFGTFSLLPPARDWN
jgi:hypothetical protein